VAVALGLVGGGIAVGSAIGDDDSTAHPTSATTGLVGSSTTARSTSQGGSTATTVAPPALDEQLEPAAAAAKAIKPAVVQLETNTGLGSGFIFSDDGHILTAAHVVGGSRTVSVRLGDGRTVEGTVLGTDPNTDVAVVKIDPFEDMPIASLALGVPLDVGQSVLAVGSPFGLEQTVTAGIVSNVDVPVEVGPSVVPMVQTDASINQGNSGGALVDLKSRVIGINDQIASTSGDNAGIGFAIPIDVAHDVAQRIISGQSLDVGFLGVASNEDPPDGRGGALVTQVTPDSPAERAGLRQGDVVIEVDGQPIRGYLELVAQVRSHRPDDRLELEVRRGDDTVTVPVTLGRR
jgi:S1-C subfamily serine protease